MDSLLYQFAMVPVYMQDFSSIHYKHWDCIVTSNLILSFKNIFPPTFHGLYPYSCPSYDLYFCSSFCHDFDFYFVSCLCHSLCYARSLYDLYHVGLCLCICQSNLNLLRVLFQGEVHCEGDSQEVGHCGLQGQFEHLQQCCNESNSIN